MRESQAGECCFARQDKAVTQAPDGTLWEYYHISDDIDEALVENDIEDVGTQDLTGHEPHSMNDAGQPTEQTQQDVDNKVPTETSLQRCC